MKFFLNFCLDYKIIFVYLQHKTNKYNKFMIKKVSMRATLAAMNPGEMVEIPASFRGYTYVRNCACLLGTDYPGRKYSVHMDRERKSYQVTRVQ